MNDGNKMGVHVGEGFRDRVERAVALAVFVQDQVQTLT
jgi:hypothetical protein